MPPSDATAGRRPALSSPPILLLLSPVINAFKKRYPNVHLQLMEAPFPHAEPLLRDGCLDFYIGAVVENPPN